MGNDEFSLVQLESTHKEVQCNKKCVIPKSRMLLLYATLMIDEVLPKMMNGQHFPSGHGTDILIDSGHSS